MKAMLTPNEYYKWVSYLSHKKPEVTEIQLAVLSTLVSNGLGGKAAVKDFLISDSGPKIQNTGGMSNDQVKAAFSGVTTVISTKQ